MPRQFIVYLNKKILNAVGMKQRDNQVACHMKHPNRRALPLLLLKAGFAFQLHEFPEGATKNGKGSYEDVQHHDHCLIIINLISDGSFAPRERC